MPERAPLTTSSPILPWMAMTIAGGILLILGVLHGLNLIALPVMGRLLTLNRRLDEETRELKAVQKLVGDAPVFVCDVEKQDEIDRLLAAGGEHVGDLDMLRASPGVFGPVPSNATVSPVRTRASCRA